MDTTTMERLIKAAAIITEHNNEQAAALRAKREHKELTHCIECGRQITDWDTIEQTDTELIQTYICPCGCVAEQHYQLTYTGTTIVK